MAPCANRLTTTVDIDYCATSRLDPVRDKPRRSGRGRVAQTAKPCYNGIADDNQGSLRQGMPEVTPVEIRVAVAHSAQEPTEATQEWLNAAPERRRNPPTLGGGGCQKRIEDAVRLSLLNHDGYYDGLAYGYYIADRIVKGETK